MKLLEIINNEFKEARSRKELGRGVEHTVYPSTNEPNVVYKLGPKRTVDKWYETFKNNPDIFPNVYKRGKTKIKLKTDQDILTPNGYVKLKAGDFRPIEYVKLEKLDTKRVEKEWGLIDNAIEEISERDGYEFLDFLINYMNNFDNEERMAIEKELSKNKMIYDLFLKYMSVVDRLLSVVKGEGKNIPDIHRYNFGYDKEGNLKCLDF